MRLPHTIMFAVFVWSVLAQGAGLAQPPSPMDATGRISGRVVAADGSSPLPGVEVQLGGSGGGRFESRASITDDGGRYTFASLPAGLYSVRALRPGHVALSYGQNTTRDPTRSIHLAVGQARDAVDISLPQTGCITVHVVDEYGNPRGQVGISALQKQALNGELRLAPVAIDPSDILASLFPRTIETDDRGAVRLYDLPPGDYYVKAEVPLFRGYLTDVPDAPAGRDLIYPPTYFPATPLAQDASPVSLGPGEELHITITLAPARAAHVSGIVISTNGTPAEGYVTLGWAGSSGAFSRAPLDGGTFMFDNLAPGEYVIERDTEEQGSALVEYHALPITVEGDDLSGLVLTTSPQGALQGRVVFDTGSPPPDVEPDGFSISASARFGPSGFVHVNDDWTFRLETTKSPSVVSALLPNDWYVKTILLGGADVTETPLSAADGLEGVVTRRTTTVTGRVTTAQGDVLVASSVVIFSQDPRQWSPDGRTVQSTGTDAQGRYTVTELPPGRYLAVAISARRSEPPAAEVLERLKGLATPVTLGDGESTTLDLRAVSF